MTRRITYTVSAAHNGKLTWVSAAERLSGIEIMLHRITDDPVLSPTEARELARALYLLAARVEKRLVQEPHTTNTKEPPVAEGGDEARKESQAPALAVIGPDGVGLREAPRVA